VTASIMGLAIMMAIDTNGNINNLMDNSAVISNPMPMCNLSSFCRRSTMYPSNHPASV